MEPWLNQIFALEDITKLGIKLLNKLHEATRGDERGVREIQAFILKLKAGLTT